MSAAEDRHRPFELNPAITDRMREVRQEKIAERNQRAREARSKLLDDFQFITGRLWVGPKSALAERHGAAEWREIFAKHGIREAASIQYFLNCIIVAIATKDRQIGELKAEIARLREHAPHRDAA